MKPEEFRQIKNWNQKWKVQEKNWVVGMGKTGWKIVSGDPWLERSLV